MTDYATLIDAETWAFIERTNSFYPPETIDFTIAEQRAVYDRLCRAFFAGYPAGVSAQNDAITSPAGPIPIRIYAKGSQSDATVLYFHGGGFVVGGLESHDDICAEICAATGFEVVSVDYRLAPEHTHPAQFEDALAAFGWVASTRTGPILLAGDSAGGNLAAAVSHAVRTQRRAAVGQVLIYPGLGGDEAQGSYIEHAEAPMLSARDIAFYREVRAGNADVSRDPSFAPLADRDFSGLPPSLIVTAQCDPLSSDGEAYRDRLVEAGGKAVWIEEPGLVHGYLRARHSVARARQSFARLVEAIGALGRGEWRY